MHKIVVHAEKYQKEWALAKPFSHLVVEDVIHEEQAVDLLTALSQIDFEKKESDLFTFFQSKDLNSSTVEVIEKLRDQLTSKPVLSALEKITSKKLSGRIDLHATIYGDTHHLLCHDDQVEDRALAFMIYLTDLEDDEGGELCLYNRDGLIPKDIVKRIQPRSGMFATFGVGDGSFHSVDEVVEDVQRIAIAGWYHEGQ